MNLGKNLRRLREAAGLTHCELADQVGVSQAMISYTERDKKIPSAVVLKNIAKVLNVTIDELMQD